jgi:predicted  nucleic acid-binding Zn-ribbon protein
MDTLFVWILMFAGAAVALLGLVLVASERELKIKRREIDALLAKLEHMPHGAAPPQSTQPEADSELAELRAQNRNLQNELNALSSELDQSRSDVAELRTSQQSSASNQIENQQLSTANDRLSREVNELRSRLAASEAQIGSPVVQSHDEGQLHARMQAELDETRRRLDESRTRIRELETAPQNLPDLNAIEATHRQERESLHQRIAEIAQQAAQDREKLAELQTLRDRLAESENIQNELRDEIRHREEEIPRWQARIAAGEEGLRRLAELQMPCNELLSKQAALADRQRQLQEELVAFAHLIAAAADGTQQLRHAPDTDDDERSNASPQPPSSKPSSSGSLSTTVDTPSEMRVAQNVTAEATGNTTPAVPGGRRYGILGALLLIGAVGVFGFRLFNSDLEQAARRKAIANSLDRGAPAQRVDPTVISRSEERPVESPSAPGVRAPAQVKSVAREKPAPVTVKNQPAPLERAALGTYRVVRASRVYAAPNELSRSLGDIEPGVNVNVVDARDGWLEIHSKHGRPPGFIRREAASRVTGQN